MDVELEQAINKIMVLRLTMLPPYSYDWDEAEKDVSDYVDFYTRHILTVTPSIDSYTAALKEFRDRPSEDAFSNLVTARSVFISSFPFAQDEIEDMQSEEINPFLEYMRGIYVDEASDHLIEALYEYRNLCQILSAKIFNDC